MDKLVNIYILTAFGHPKRFTVHSLIDFISIVCALGIDSMNTVLQVTLLISFIFISFFSVFQLALVFKINMKQFTTHFTSCKMILKLDYENGLDRSTSEFVVICEGNETASTRWFNLKSSCSQSFIP